LPLESLDGHTIVNVIAARSSISFETELNFLFARSESEQQQRNPSVEPGQLAHLAFPFPLSPDQIKTPSAQSDSRPTIPQYSTQ
jgi:hypothetical protein